MMMALLGIVDDATVPIPLSPEIAEFMGESKPLSMMECVLYFEQFTHQINNNTVQIDPCLQKLFKTNQSVISTDQFNNYIFAHVPLMTVNNQYIDYYLTINSNRYLLEDLQIDRKMFNIAIGYIASPLKSTSIVRKFSHLPDDIIYCIQLFLHDNKIPFGNPYYLTLYKSNTNHDPLLVKFWESI